MKEIIRFDLPGFEGVRRFYRPVIFYGPIATSVLLYLYLSDGGLDLTGVLAVSITVVVYVFSVSWLGHRAVLRFVDGLRDGGIEVEVLDDEFSFTGSYAQRLRTSVGTYRVESVIGSVLYARYYGPNAFGWEHIPLLGARTAGVREARKQFAQGDK